MKKLIASVTCFFVAIASLSLVPAANKLNPFSVDVVAAATGETTPTPPTPPKNPTPPKTTTPAQTTSTTSTIKLSRLIKLGRSGNDVKNIQGLLNNFAAKLKVDGIFGRLTLAAVKSFQKKYGLRVDGIVGSKTYSKIVALIEASKPTYKYQDGVYVAYSDASTKGNEAARVTIKNDKIVNVELMRLSPKMIDREASASYAGLWPAFETLKSRMIGKTQAEVKKIALTADAVAGATTERSAQGWSKAVDRAFTRALITKPAGQTYFEGTHMGVDPQGKYMVFATFDKTKLTGVKVYPIGSTGSAIEDAAMTTEQARVTYLLGSALLQKGLQMTPVTGLEADSAYALKAFWDAEQNARVNNESKYIDGWYSGYAGEARDKGEEKAEVYIRNGKLVDLKLYRLGADLKDRGATAYEFVVAANAPMTAKFLERGFYIENFVAKDASGNNVDAYAKATESSTNWNTAIKRAFERALKAPVSKKYGNGIFAGVDNQSRLLVLVDINNDAITSVTSYLFDDAKKIKAATALTTAEKGMLAQINAGLKKSGGSMADILGFEAISAVARDAFNDAAANASTKQGQYKDGTYVIYNGSYDKGSNRTEVTLRNGKVVGLNLQRVGVNLVDRGASAYKPLVDNIPKFLQAFMDAATREKAKLVDIHIKGMHDGDQNPVTDAVAGATSGHSGQAFKEAIEIAYSKAELVKPVKYAYNNGIFAANDTAKSVYVMVTVEKNLPSKLEIYFLGADGKLVVETALTDAQKAARAEILKEENVSKMLAKLSLPTGSISAENKTIFDAVNAALKTALESAKN